MFGFRVVSKVDSVKNIIDKVKIPLLTLDQVWLELFPREFKSGRIVESEVKIKNLMIEESKLNDKRRQLTDDKHKCINNINMLTPAVYVMENKKAKAEMEKNKIKIVRLNCQLVLINRKLKAIGEQINDCNNVLLEETVRICYEQMNKNKEKIEELNPRLEKLREEIFSLIAEKTASEELYENTYNLLHKLIGHDMIDVLDHNKAQQQEMKKWFWV